jgi:hypothetical protein
VRYVSADLFTSAYLRDDIAAGEVSAEQFAANLQDVIKAAGPESYRDPARFFETTHPSTGMRELLNEALGRVSGAKANAPSLIRMETSLGGGKTHSLIALYHAARGHLKDPYIDQFIDRANLPNNPINHIATLIGDSVGGGAFPSIDGIAANTMWGYLALQLRGKEGYAFVEQVDLTRTAPGADAFESVIGDEPTIIMIDEIARYLTVAAGIVTGDNTLAVQTNAFLPALARAVEAKPNAVLVITTTETTDVFGDQIVSLLKGFRDLAGRKEHVIAPSGDSDISSILARRLFKTIEPNAAKVTAANYAAAIAAAVEQGATLPEDMTQTTWARAVEKSYPFHPNLIYVLDKRISTLPNFQRTRGALRLLALAVRALWQKKPANTELIHLYHLDLKQSQIVEEVTGHINRSAFKPVIEADIASALSGAPAHAEIIDVVRGDHYAQRIATTIYYWSLTRDIPGVLENQLLGSVLAPGDDLPKCTRAFEELTSANDRGAWYLSHDPRGGYRFSTEASPNRVLQEIRDAIQPTAVAAKSTDILDALFRDSSLKVKKHWQGASVPDNFKDVYLVIFHWDEFGNDRGIQATGLTPASIKDTWEHSPSGGLRNYRNRLVFLAPDKNQHQQMLDAVRKSMALSELIRSSENMARFSEDQRAELRKQQQQSELEARVAVAAHMSVLLYPQLSALQTLAMPPVTKADATKNQTESVLEQLKSIDKVLVTGGLPYSPTLLKAKLGTFFDTPQTTQALEERLAQNSDFKILMDSGALIASIRTGVTNGDWEYNDASLGDRGWSTKLKSGGSIQISANTSLYPTGSSPPQPTSKCPICGEVHDPSFCPKLGGGGHPPRPNQSIYTEQGAAGAITTQLIAKASDAMQVISSFTYAIDILDKALIWDGFARLTALLHSSTKGLTQRYDINATVDLKVPGDRFTVSFCGVQEDLNRIKDSLRSLLVKPDNRSATMRASLAITLDEAATTDSDIIASIRSGAYDRGPNNCSLTMVTKEPGS